jgi:D-alanyl-D-alanine carboxypeptidase
MMWNRIGLAVAAVLWWAHADVAIAGKARCRGAVAYHGQALRAAVSMPDVHGSIDGELAPATVERLRAAVATARQATQAPSMTLAIAVPGSGRWTSETIGPDQAQRADPPLHFWASAGKTFVAVVVLQLVEEGKIALSDPVSRWIADVPNGEAITIEHLLSHTSGLFSANEDVRLRAERRYHTPAENLAIARKQGALFCPGEAWRYSNTGYDLLGLIVERVDGRSYPAAIAARIIAPLGLTRLRVLAPGEASSDVARLVSAKDTPMNPSWAGAAGAIVGSADDMLRFWHALLTHRLLKPETMQRMFARLYPMFTPVESYGLGVMCFDVPEADGSTSTWLGHAGGTPGASAIVAYSLADRAFVAVALTGDGSSAATANVLLRALRAPSSPR